MTDCVSLLDIKDDTTRCVAAQAFWKSIHTLLSLNKDPEVVIAEMLRMAGQSFGADRAYTFSVSVSRTHSSCTNEWARRPELALKPQLQDIDQRGLKGWLDRFKSSTNIYIEDVDAPPDDLRQPAAKFKRDFIRSIYVFGFYDEGRLVGYLGIDYVDRVRRLDSFEKDMLNQLASTLNLYILRHESLELWNRTATALPSALFIKDVSNDLRYAYANPKYRSLFGENIVGMNDIEAFGEEIGTLFRLQDWDCLRSGTPLTMTGPQYNYSRVAEGFYSTIKFPVMTKMGRRYIAGFITDITAEHQLRMQALDLLEKSKSAETAKSLFLVAMSHEIRTPLNAIIGLVDELRHNDIPEETRAEYLKSVAVSSHALLALINDVLDISKVEAGQMHMTPVETDILLLLAECDSMFSEGCRGKGLAYECEVSPDLPIVMMDTSRLRQILINLIGNAVKFTEVGRVYVCGEFTRQGEKTGTLEIEVSDTGIGISAEDQNTVFGMFEQASRMRGTSVANKGTGLGLCLCKRLAECMNGTITLNSELGKGSSFTVTFNDVPYVERDKASDVIKHRKDRTIRINPISLSARVLIVDDVPMNLKVLGIILKRMHIDAVPANSASDAPELLGRENNGITHVLTDIWMPDMNGEQLARAIRANPAWSKIRIAAQTADVEASDNFDTRLFDTILSKPLTPEKVFAFLRTE